MSNAYRDYLEDLRSRFQNLYIIFYNKFLLDKSKYVEYFGEDLDLYLQGMAFAFAIMMNYKIDDRKDFVSFCIHMEFEKL